MTLPRIEPAGDAGWSIVWDDPPVGAHDARALAVAERIVSARAPGVLDAVPGVGCVVVSFDPLVADPTDVRAAALHAALEGEIEDASPPRTIEIPVLYDAGDPDVSPDLAALAAEKQLDVGELVARHVRPTYRCVMLGFRPGFAYLDGLDPALAAPRLATPRSRVPAGAVGIGGAQTGVYPVASPGGWRLIGRTSARLFDPDRDDPFLVHAGDRVRFVPVDRSTFERGR